MEFDEALISVWKQALVDKLSSVEVDHKKFPVRTTAKRKLKQIDFVLDGRDIRGLGQNPDTKSRWAKAARADCTASRTVTAPPSYNPEPQSSRF